MPRTHPQRGAAMRGRGAGWRGSSRGSEKFLRAVGLRGSRRSAAGGGVCGRDHSVRGVEWGGEAQQRQAISRSLCGPAERGISGDVYIQPPFREGAARRIPLPIRPPAPSPFSLRLRVDPVLKAV